MKKTIMFALAIAASSAHALDMNWNYCDDNWWDARNYPYPWFNDSEGIPIATYDCQTYQSDWEVYDRMLDRFDGTLNPPQPPLGGPGIPTTPTNSNWFSLYNRKTGMLRTFLYIPAEIGAVGQEQVIKMDVTTPAGVTRNHGLFLHDGPGKMIPFSQRDAANDGTTSPSYVIPFTKRKKWIITDTYLSYDPTHYATQSSTSTTPYFLRYQYQVFNKTNVSLAGSASVDMTTGSDGADQYIKIAATAGNVARTAFNGFAQAADGPQSVANAVHRAGSWSVLKGNTSVGVSLLNLSDNLAVPGAPLAMIMGGTSLVSSLLSADWTGSRVSFPSFNINLKGYLEHVYTAESVSIPLASSVNLQQKNIFAAKFPNKDEQKLGLLSLSARPKVRMVYIRKLGWWATGIQYAVLWDRYIKIDDLNCVLQVNPASGAKIRHMKVWVKNITSNWQTTTNALDGLPAPPPADYSVINPHPETSMRYTGRLRQHPSVSYDRNTVNARPLRSELTPNTSAVTLKVLVNLEIAPGEFMDVVKEVDAEVAENIIGPLTTVPYGQLVQESLPTNLARSYVNCGGSVDPVHRIRTGGISVGISYFGDANWYLRQSGAPELGGAPYAVSGYVHPEYGYSAMVIGFYGNYVTYKIRNSSGEYGSLRTAMDWSWDDYMPGTTNWTTVTKSVPLGQHELVFYYSNSGPAGPSENRGMVAALQAGTR